MSDGMVVFWSIAILGFVVYLIVIRVRYNKLSPEEKEAKMKEIEEKRQEYRERHYAPKNSDGEIVCPNCGSKQITLLNRRWSATTGIFTNKVDRVCMNCKKRF